MLNPEQIAEQEVQLKQSPIIQTLMETDETLYQELKTLEEGQEGIQSHLNEVDTRLEDGSKVMADLKDDVKSLKNIFTNHATRTEQMHQETKDALKDHKYQDLREEKKELQKQIEDGKKESGIS